MERVLKHCLEGLVDSNFSTLEDDPLSLEGRLLQSHHYLHPAGYCKNVLQLSLRFWKGIHQTDRTNLGSVDKNVSSGPDGQYSGYHAHIIIMYGRRIPNTPSDAARHL